VVALLADGLTDRGHELTLFAAPGSDTKAGLVAPLHEEPPRDAIGDPWYEASHVVSVYEHGDDFDILHDHTGPVGVSVGALSNCPTIHTCTGRSPSRPYALQPGRPPALVRGHLREPESVEEMAAAVKRLGELDPRALRSRVEQRFSAEAMVAGYERAYAHTLAGEGTTS
jgi:Glycosyltransferase Family 4